MINPFSFARIPEIIFGNGKIHALGDKINDYGKHILLITSGGSFIKTERFDNLLLFFKQKSIHYSHYKIQTEPSPQNINEIVKENGDKSVDVVISIGGGSVLDAGKAVSAMLDKKESVEDFLEGVGTKLHDGTKVPFIAIPTTSGTGSETTKNAVLTQLGENGFKKSLRHNNFVPDVAIVDPELTVTCPSDVTAACGLDAFTQLLESYVSTGSSPMTDALAYSGLQLLNDNLVSAATTSAQDLAVRSAMSYAALMSGITLANAGLGVVHGLASPIGSFYDIPHGVACGTLVGTATKVNIEKLRQIGDTGGKYLLKYARIGKLLSGDKCSGIESCCEYLIEKITEWIEILSIPKLRAYGYSEYDVDKTVSGTGMKNNPVHLEKDDLRQIILERL